MTPVAFDGCFGWLHPAAGDCGVVMCGSIGFEKQIFHRSWSFLAQRLAAGGYPTLRFDYPGSGDSCGMDSDPGALEAWLGSIGQAIAWLRANTGARRIVLCGIHLGGLLAAAAAARDGEVERLVLLAPMLSGRSYARILALSTTSNAAPPADGSEAGHVEAFGLRLHGTTLHALRRLDLSSLPTPPAQKLLVLSASNAAATHGAVAALSASGVEVTLLDMPDYLELTRPAHESQVPVASFDRVLAWLAATGQNSADAPGQTARLIPIAELSTPHAIERPLLLDRERGRLFGMFSQPRGPSGACPAVLICNTGANPHYGFGRLAVALARGLAEDGVASLRLDLTGIGDSDGASTVSLPDLYADRSGDLRAAADFLQQRGYDHVVVFGICTGAFHSIRAGLGDPRVAGVVLVNQNVYRWRHNPVLLRAAVLLRMLRRRMRDESMVDAEQGVLRLKMAPPAPVTNRLRRSVWRAAVVAEHTVLRPLGLRTPLGFPTRAFRQLASRGVRVLVVAGEDDYARSLLQAQFGPSYAELTGMGGIRVEIEAGFDHPVGRSGARNRLVGLVRQFVAEFAATSAEQQNQDAPTLPAMQQAALHG